MTPLFTKLKEHAASNPFPFHIPGHKKGKGMDAEYAEFVGSNVLSIDLVSIPPLDDPHQPNGVIQEAQNLAAQAFGADHSFFCVQGTTGAVMMMILSVCSPGDKIILPRNVHKSILSAVIFSGAHPIFIHPQMDSRLGIAHGITTDDIEKAIQQHLDAKAVLIINPTYFGVASNLKEIVDMVHSYRIPVLVDEAHGALTHFHEELPMSAMEAGADLAATSVHKLGGSLTQSSILNMREGLVNPHYVQLINSMITTTSSSYLLLSSLDIARRHLAMHGKEIIGNTLALARNARWRINQIPGLSCFGKEYLSQDGLYDLDETKLFIHLEGLRISGRETEKWLRKEFNIEIELSDLYNILCLITTGDTRETVDILIYALQTLSDQFYSPGLNKSLEITLPEIPKQIQSPREAFYSETVSVPLDQAAGEVSGEFLMTYPPGIPIFIPGEEITDQNIRYLQKHIDAGLSVHGTMDRSARTIRVVRY